MNLGQPQIGRAEVHDADGILALMTANQPEKGGLLSANLSRETLVTMLQAQPCVVARQADKVVGFLLTGTRAMSNVVPVVRAMLTTYTGTPDAYVYGPVCVARELRGQGTARAMFAHLRQLLPQREGILFVRNDNAASLQAHRKMGMRVVGDFEFNHIQHTVFAYRG